MEDNDVRIALLTCDALLDESSPDSGTVSVWKDDLKLIMEIAYQYLDLCD